MAEGPNIVTTGGRPIFIVGSERSGTTLLRLLLHAHPRMAIPPQTKFVRKLYKRRLLFGNLNKPRNKLRLVHWFRTHFDGNTKLVDLGLESDAIEQAVAESAPTLGSALGAVFKTYSRKWDKARWGDKRPYYIKHLPVLYRLYPQAQVIHLVRDGRDCVSSLMGMPWWRRGTMEAILNWQEAIRKGRRARTLYSPDRYLELKYEDLVSDPEGELRLVCRFLGEEYDPAMLEYTEIAALAVPRYKLDWHERTQQKIDRTAIGKWRDKLSPADAALIERYAGEELTERGYQLSQDLPAVPPGAQLVFIGASLKYHTRRLGLTLTDALMTGLYVWPLAYRDPD